MGKLNLCQSIYSLPFKFILNEQEKHLHTKKCTCFLWHILQKPNFYFYENLRHFLFLYGNETFVDRQLWKNLSSSTYLFLEDVCPRWFVDKESRCRETVSSICCSCIGRFLEASSHKLKRDEVKNLPVIKMSVDRQLQRNLSSSTYVFLEDVCPRIRIFLGYTTQT